MDATILLHLAGYILLPALCVLAGAALLALLPAGVLPGRRSTVLLYGTVLAGWLVVLLVYSGWHTRLATVNMGYALLAGGLWWAVRGHFLPKEKGIQVSYAQRLIGLLPRERQLALLAGVFGGLWMLNLLYVYHWPLHQPGPENVHAEDSIVYSIKAWHIQHNGQENFASWRYSRDDAYTGTLPYHYMDLWLANIAQAVDPTPGTTTYTAYQYHARPMLAGILLLGIAGVLQWAGLPLWLALLLGLAALLPQGATDNILTPSHHVQVLNSYMPLYYSKVLVLGIFIPLACVFLLQGQAVLATGVLAAACLASVSGLPGLAVSGLAILLPWLRRPAAFVRANWRALAVLAGFAVVYLLWYGLQTPAAVPYYTEPDLDLPATSDVLFARLRFHYISYSVYLVLNTPWPFMLAAVAVFSFLFSRKKEKELPVQRILAVLLLLTGVGVAYLIKVLLDGYRDGFQFYYAVHNVLWAGVVAALLALLWRPAPRRGRVAMAAAAALPLLLHGTGLPGLSYPAGYCQCDQPVLGYLADGCFTRQPKFDVRWQQQLAGSLAADPAPQVLVGVYWGQQDFKKSPRGWLLGPTAMYAARNGVDLVNLGMDSALAWADTLPPGRLRSSMQVLAANDYYLRWKASHPCGSADSCQQGFIRAQGIRHLLLLPGYPLPAYLAGRTDLDLTDPQTGWRYLHLRQ